MTDHSTAAEPWRMFLELTRVCMLKVGMSFMLHVRYSHGCISENFHRPVIGDFVGTSCTLHGAKTASHSIGCIIGFSLWLCAAQLCGRAV